jgi:hypothetical protein
VVKAKDGGGGGGVEQVLIRDPLELNSCWYRCRQRRGARKRGLGRGDFYIIPNFN